MSGWHIRDNNTSPKYKSLDQNRTDLGTCTHQYHEKQGNDPTRALSIKKKPSSCARRETDNKRRRNQRRGQTRSWCKNNDQFGLLKKQLFTHSTKPQVRLIHYYSVENQPSNHLSMNNNICFGTYLYSVRTHHRNLLKSLTTMRMVIYLILQAHTGNCVKPKILIDHWPQISGT